MVIEKTSDISKIIGDTVAKLANDIDANVILFITRNKENDSYNVFKGNLSDEVGQTLKELCFKLSNKSYKKPYVQLRKQLDRCGGAAVYKSGGDGKPS